MRDNIHSENNMRPILTKESWLYFIILIINTVFGLQILNSFFSLLVNFFRERPGINLFHVAIYAFITFAVIFLTGFLFKFVKKRYLFLILVISISLIRFLIQVCRFSPISLAASALGIVLWVTGLAFFISLVQQRKIGLFYTFFPALILGFSLNTGLNGLFGTWDMIWRLEYVTIFFVLILVLLQIILVLIASKDIKNDTGYTDGAGSAFYSLTAFMPFVLLQLFQFQNIASFNAKATSGTVESSSIIIFSNLIAITSIYFIRKKILRIILVPVFAVLFIISFWPGLTGIVYVLQVIIGNTTGWWLLTILLERAVSYPEKKTPWKNITSLGISGIILFVFTFIYYGSYDINIPLKNWMIIIFAAAIISIFGLLCLFLGYNSRKSISKKESIFTKPVKPGKYSFFKKAYLKYNAIFFLLLIFIIPLIIAIPIGSKAETEIQKETVRLMHYNIHQGFNIDGYQDLESIARVIEKNGADIICLNEVSRGWLINGSADVYLWLSDRLDMDYKIFMPASDLIWGNAILSKYPLDLIKSGFLPRMDAPLRRSYIYAGVDLGKLGIDNINVMSTHLHQIIGEGKKRQAQVDALLTEWDGLERTAICGDFNAVADDKEIQMMKNAGLIDAQLALGKQDELTWVHYKPYRRIDYIWVTPDIMISDLLITYSRASDHLPISLSLK